jgi:septation ring formation regulator EzrA
MVINLAEFEHRLTAVEESAKSAHKRIDETDELTSGIHELAADIKVMTSQLTEHVKRSDANNERIEDRQRSQGERIGRLETEQPLVVQAVNELKNLVSTFLAKVEALEKEPGQKWKAITAQIVSLIVTALVTGAIVKFTGQ